MTFPHRRKIEEDLIALLKERGPTTPADAYRELAAQWNLSEEEIGTLRGGRPRYQHDIRWCRQGLVIQGVIHRHSERGLWRLRDEILEPTDLGDEVSQSYSEGSSISVRLNRYERSAEGRRRCLKLKGYSCTICGMNFEDRYGALGRGCIHVHHIRPLGSIREKYELNPETDLVPICPNCHYIVHRKNPPFEIDQVKAMLAANGT